MTEKQLQKWATVRAKGQMRFVIPRALLWGSILSIWNITRSYLILHYFASPMAEAFVSHIFGSEPQSPEQTVDFDFIRSSIRDISICLLIGVALAFAHWAWKERQYAQAQPSQPT